MKLALNIFAYSIAIFTSISTDCCAQLTDISLTGVLNLSTSNGNPNATPTSSTAVILNGSVHSEVMGTDGVGTPIATANMMAAYTSTASLLSVEMNYSLNSLQRFASAGIEDGADFFFTLNTPSYVTVDWSISGNAPILGILRSLNTPRYWFVGAPE